MCGKKLSFPFLIIVIEAELLLQLGNKKWSSTLAPLHLLWIFLMIINSWDLFCDKTFGQEGFPPELEQIGRKIVRKCKGLSLAIDVIGGLLGKSPRT